MEFGFYSTRSLYAVARLSVCLSSVGNARAPYSRGSNFRQYFYVIRYLCHPLASTEKFHGDRPRGTPPPGELNKRGSQIAISDLSTAISRKRCKIRGKLVLITNRKSYMSFRLLPKSVTSDYFERRNGRYFALFQRIRIASGHTA